MSEPLDTAECHVWVVHAPESLPKSRVAEYESFLDDEEARRYRAFHFERHAHAYLLTRGLVRHTLARYLDVAPDRFRFGIGSHGKPELLQPSFSSRLGFNLSNTDKMIVCAVARDADVGVDVEHEARLDDPIAIADRYFSKRELHDLMALAPERQRERFFAYWTLKEAYIKARGLGLAIPLDRFSFLLAEGTDRIEIAFAPELDDDPDGWQFERVRVGAPHALALAIRRGARENLRVKVRDADELVISSERA